MDSSSCSSSNSSVLMSMMARMSRRAMVYLAVFFNVLQFDLAVRLRAIELPAARICNEVFNPSCYPLAHTINGSLNFLSKPESIW